MSDPLSSAVLSLFQVSARTTAPCTTINGQVNCAGLFGRNRGNRNFGGTQNNSAGVGSTGSSRP